MTHGIGEALACAPREDLRASGEDRNQGRGGSAVVQKTKKSETFKVLLTGVEALCNWRWRGGGGGGKTWDGLDPGEQYRAGAVPVPTDGRGSPDRKIE